jgi:hypothetical protein
MFRTITFAFLLVAFPIFSGVADALTSIHTLESPNGDFKVIIADGPLSQLGASVFYKGEQIVVLGPFGFLLDSGEPIPCVSPSREYDGYFQEMIAKGQRPPKRYEAIRGPRPNLPVGFVIVCVDGVCPTYPEYSEVRNDGEVPYNETDVEYVGFMKVVFRAYDTGIAFRYEFTPKEGETLTIQKEITQFLFSDDYLSKTKQVKLSEINGVCESPMVVELTKDLSLSLGEAPATGFSRLKFRFGKKWESSFNNLYDGFGKINRTGKPTTVNAVLDGDVVICSANNSPWRYVGITNKDSEMLKSFGK